MRKSCDKSLILLGIPRRLFPSWYQAVHRLGADFSPFPLGGALAQRSSRAAPEEAWLDGSSSQGRARLQLFLMSVLSDCDFSLREIYIK